MGETAPVGGLEARPLPAELSGVLQELSQALLNLEHVLRFYPEGHSSRQAPLERMLVLLRTEAAVAGEAALAFSGEALNWRGAFYTQLPPSARKLSALLGSQGIARLRWSPELTVEEIERFLALLARGRTEGHREDLDPTMRFDHLWIDTLDYQALMAERPDGQEGLSAGRRDLWKALLLRTLAGAHTELAAEELALLREHWEDPAALAALLTEAIGPGAQAGDDAAVEAVRRFAGLVERADAGEPPLPPEESAVKLGALAHELPAALRLRLLEGALEEPADGLCAAAFGALDMGDGIALIAENFSLDPAQIGRLARVFQHLVPRRLERMELAPLLREEVRRAGNPEQPVADNAWEEVQELLTGESGEFMSPGYQEQLQRLATREEARRGGEAAFVQLPELAEHLDAAAVAVESLLIQFEQLQLATGVEHYREALAGIGGLCSAALAAGDRERGLLILRQLLELDAGDEPLAGPREEIGRTLQAIASPQALHSLLPLLDGADAADRSILRTLLSLAPAAAAPVLLEALADETDPARRREVAGLLESLGTPALLEALRLLPAAPAAVTRAVLPLLAEVRDPAAAPELLNLLGGEDGRIRRDALRALGGIDTPEVRRALPALLKDHDPEIAQLAAAHLGALGAPETVRALLQEIRGGFLAGRRADEVQRAILVLGRMRAAAAVGPLSGLLRQRRWLNRRAQERIGEAAAQALARIGGDAAKQALELAAAGGPETLAAACRRLLAKWGTP